MALAEEVSAVPLQQALRHLEVAYAAFFKRLGRMTSLQDEAGPAGRHLMKTAFRLVEGEVWLAKTTSPLPIRWSRPLPGEPTFAQPSPATRRVAGSSHSRSRCR